MTEAEWQTCDDPGPMLAFLGPRMSDRKRRLFAVACCRRVERLFFSEYSVKALDLADRLADGLAKESQRARLYGKYAEEVEDRANWWYSDSHCRYLADAATVNTISPKADAIKASDRTASAVALESASEFEARLANEEYEMELAELMVERPDLANTVSDATKDAFDTVRATERRAQADLLREVVGNPFRPANIAPAWRTKDVVTLAKVIYEEERFANVPVLADALEEAGASADLLEHLRGPGPHVRGCWVIDLLLGKS